GLAFSHSSEDPSTTSRVVTITSLTDSGSNVGNNDNVSAPNINSTVSMTAVNDAPVNTVPSSQSVDEDTALSISGISVSDVEGMASTQLSVNDGTLTVSLSGSASISSGANGSSSLTISGNQSDINATLSSLSYQGDLNFNGSDTLTVLSTDNDGTPLTDSDTVSITVNAVNDENTPPTAENNTININEDQRYIFSASDFNFSDIDNGDTLESIQITSLVTQGTLQYDVSNQDAWQDLVTGQIISADHLNEGRFRFVSGENEHADNYASFNFKVSDGESYSETAYLMTINVIAVNDSATGSVTISGLVQAGSFLSGSFDIEDIEGVGEVNYQWLRNGEVINGASSIEYLLTDEDVGKQLSLKVAFLDNEGFSESVISSSTDKVAIRSVISDESLTELKVPPVISHDSELPILSTASNLGLFEERNEEDDLLEVRVESELETVQEDDLDNQTLPEQEESLTASNSSNDGENSQRSDQLAQKDDSLKNKAETDAQKSLQTVEENTKSTNVPVSSIALDKAISANVQRYELAKLKNALLRYFG
ncbi:cadherin-like domain-containing protein, partial [Fangia hongkongensis]|uniref:cadherin-like domain-containing protein n=1 Tax=Fangia hongkongensis TaxID=270495 RepID=UPI001903FEEA